MRATLTPDVLLQGYSAGIFPMADRRDSPEIHWVDPLHRGVIPLDGFRISRSLRRTIRRGAFTIRFDTAFEAVLDGCAARPETWINAEIRALSIALHEMRHAHSVEVWEGDTLVGGSYGVALGAAWFGESMFSRRTDASKVALAYLVDRLRAGGFMLFDTQFLTDHLARLGGQEISRRLYRARLAEALSRRASFDAQGAVPSPEEILQRNTQTS